MKDGNRMKTGEPAATGWWGCTHHGRIEEPKSFSVRIGTDDGKAIEVFCADEADRDALLKALDKFARKAGGKS